VYTPISYKGLLYGLPYVLDGSPVGATDSAFKSYALKALKYLLKK
jgi:hypothetical protein